MMAKLAITASYGAVYVYTAEQFPTVVRNMGLGVGSFFARIGGIVAPYINNTVRQRLCFVFVMLNIYEYTAHAV